MRPDGHGTRDGVVLLHGIARGRGSMRRLEGALREHGFSTLNLGYESRRHGLLDLAEAIEAAVLAFGTTVRGRLHFVGHSMGGLLARAHVARHRPARLGAIVTIGTPHRGSRVADALKASAPYRAFYGPAGQDLTPAGIAMLDGQIGTPDYPLGAIAGTRARHPLFQRILPRPNDGTVALDETLVDGMSDHVGVHGGHTWLAAEPVAIAQTIAFLRHGRFMRPDESGHQTSETP